MPRKADLKAQTLQKHRLTLAQLASYDDVLTDALAYYWSRIRKNRENKYLPLRGIKQDEVPQILLHKVIIAKDIESAEKALLDLAGLRRYIGGLRTEAETKDFYSHLRKYVNMYLPDCPFEVSTTNRYTVIGHEAAVTARKRIREGDRIKYLCGTLVPLTDTELKDLDLSQRNFSIVQSDRKKNTLIFLGPARFANHDCAANGRLVSVGKDGLEVHATRNIEFGEEITVTYSPGYFGANNQECLCRTCELQGKNGWASIESVGSAQSPILTPHPDGDLSPMPYSPRKKRKHGSETGFGQSDHNSSWQKKQKLGRPSSRLNQVLTPPRSSESLEVEPILSARRESENGSSERSTAERAAAVEHAVPGTESGFCLGSTTGVIMTADPRKIRRLRLIDQMSPSISSSPEKTGKRGPYSTFSDELRSNSSLSKTTSLITQPATTTSEEIISIKSESPEASVMDEDVVVLQSSAPLIAEPRVLDRCDPGSVERSMVVVPDRGITDGRRLYTEYKTSDIIPSIEESPATDLLGVPNLPKIQRAAASAATDVRTPGDYILTRRLIAQPFDRWVHCQTCFEYFLQSNGYQTRRECPRCERHSMLHGFGWPKTEPDARRLREIKETREKAASTSGRGRWRSGDTIVVGGPATSTTTTNSPRGRGRGRRYGGLGRSGRSGKGSWVEGGGEEEREERVMDHRTVNRFIAPEEEREVRKRGRDSLLDYANRPSVGGVSNNGNGDTTTSLGSDAMLTPDRILLARIRGNTGNALAALAERGYACSSNASTTTDENIGNGALVDNNGTDTAALLRRSRRYFSSTAAS